MLIQLPHLSDTLNHILYACGVASTIETVATHMKSMQNNSIAPSHA